MFSHGALIKFLVALSHILTLRCALNTLLICCGRFTPPFTQAEELSVVLMGLAAHWWDAPLSPIKYTLKGFSLLASSVIYLHSSSVSFSCNKKPSGNYSSSPNQYILFPSTWIIILALNSVVYIFLQISVHLYLHAGHSLDTENPFAR